MAKKAIKKRYQIALSSFDGISPQKFEVFDSKEEAEAWARKRNEQDFKDKPPYAQWIVIEKSEF